MSNLISPMLTSVENSPIVDFYTSPICFSSSPCAIVNKGTDQLCLNDPEHWNDLEHLVGGCSNLFKTSTPNKAHNAANIFTNNQSSSNFNSKVLKLKEIDNKREQNSEISCISNYSPIKDSQVINNLWNSTISENNSCSKAGVNVNMGYNGGSSLESMINSKKDKNKQDFINQKSIVESNITKKIESTSNVPNTTDINAIKVFTQSAPQPSTIKFNDEVKTFKNGAKAGHSRLWGSCGATVTQQLNSDKNYIKDQLLLDKKLTLNDDVVQSRPAISKAMEIRNQSFSQNNGHKRISQLSFEAEFDSEGRTHEQISIDFRKYDPFLMSGQITLIELSYFKAIKPEEFLSFKWTSISKHSHAPGIVAATRWFNQLNFWAQRIILECKELNRRTEMLAYLIRIIKKLVDCYNNLSSGMALMSALEVECIHRLKQTWNNLQSKDRATFRRMEELFSSANNYEKLRDHINSLKLPCIPYLGLYLTDLTYINIAHSKLSEFESQTKSDQINNILRTVSEFQQSEYELNQANLLFRYLESQRYIEELQKLIEDSNYRASMALEPNIADLSRQQQDFPSSFTASSPQKSSPSYTSFNASNKNSQPLLQSPITPKLMSTKSHDDLIKEQPEPPVDSQFVSTKMDDTDIDDLKNDDNVQSSITSGSTLIVHSVDNEKDKTIKESELSSRLSDEDTAKVSLLCGAGRKSYFKKRSTPSNIRFKRDSSSSSRQQISSKTATMSSTSQSDKDIVAQMPMSLLDDSYLDATLTDNRSGTVTIGVGQAIDHGDLLTVSNTQVEKLSSPPMCRFLIKGGTVDLKSKASYKYKTQYSNLVNLARAAETAAQMTETDSFYDPSNISDSVTEVIFDESQNPDNKDVFKVLCQGVLTRKAVMKNGKSSRFSLWNRYWVVLIVSKNDAILVFFENSQFRAVERKDFKSKKCHVQDLKNVIVSQRRPSFDNKSSEYKPDLPQSYEDSNFNQNIKKFFLFDKEYGLVYKFKDPRPSKSRTMKERKPEYNLQESQSNNSQIFTSVTLWYQLLKRSIDNVNRPSDDHKDLIVLGDS